MEKKTSTFKLSGPQDKAWCALWSRKYREIGLFSGIQGGKTIFGALAMRKFLDKRAKPGDNMIVTAPTYKIMEQATLPTFLQLHTPYVGNYNAKDAVFRSHKGVSIWFRTDTDPDSIEGIPDCIAGWMDEAGKCSRKLWVNSQGRLARRQGILLYTTTWYALNWIFKEVWRPSQLNKRDDLWTIAYKSSDNPSFPAQELERQKRILSPAEFQRKFMGEPGKVEGMVFDGFGEQNFCLPFTTDHYPVYGGIDWGFDHPTAITLRCFPGDGRCYTISIFKRSGLSVTQTLDLIASKHKMFNVKHFFCGHDRPDMIAELNKRGIPASKYFEGNENYREVNAGNQLHAELIRSGTYKIFQGIDQIEDMEDEYLSYAWKEVEEGTESKEKPVSVNDDLIAAERYLSIGTQHLLVKQKEPYKIPLRSLTKIDVWDPQEPEPKGSWDDY